MKKTIKPTLYLLCALGIFALIPTLLSKDAPIEVQIPSFDLEDINAQEAKQKEQAAKKVARRMYRCETDEDCVIVDKDPCGCWVGPSGVTAINVAYILDFNKMTQKSLAKTCPDTEPSVDKECSPSARAVCKEKVCRIVY